jgi:hypothetical protein
LSSFDEHNPPHFHAKYGGESVSIGIESLRVLDGSLSPRALGLVMEWAAMHQQELSRAWDAVSHQRTPEKIEPLR